MARRVISLQIKNNNIIRGVNKCSEDKICSTSIDLSQQKRMGLILGNQKGTFNAMKNDIVHIDEQTKYTNKKGVFKALSL